MIRRIVIALCSIASTLHAGAIRVDAAGFIENRGEWAARARYGIQLPGLSAFCADDGIVLVLTEEGGSIRPEMGCDRPRHVAVRRHALRVNLSGGKAARPIPRGEYRADRTHLLGRDRTQWAIGASTFAEVIYREAWTGIDLVLSTRGGGIEYRIEPRPGVNPEAAVLRFEGADRIERADDGSTRIVTSAGTLIARRAGPLSGRIEREGDDECSTPAQANAGGGGGGGMLPDDPSALRWGTFIGGTLEDYAYAMAVRPSGNVVVAGTTHSPDFPTTIGALADTLQGAYDAFVAELDPTGSILLWCTYVGGSGVDIAHAVALDAAGNIVLTGKTESPDFPVTSGAYDLALGGLADAYALKLDATGTSILWSTYLGGSDYEIAFGLLIDSIGGVVVAGYTQSADYPVTMNGWDRSYNGGFDIFVTKVDPMGQALTWSTFIGGTNDDRVYHACAAGSGSIFLTGWTQSPDYPVTAGVYDATYNGNSDVYVTKMSATGDVLVWSTFLGGSDIERAYAIEAGAGGNPVIAGYVRSGDFPTTPGAYDATYGGNGDGFIASLNEAGTALLWSTFLGGMDEDRCHDLALDAGGDPVVTGSTLSMDFPTTAGTYDETYAGAGDAFGAALDPSGRSLLWGTFIGGSGWDMGNAMASSDARSILVCGETESTDFPTTAGAFDQTPNGMIDGFVAKVAIRGVSEIPGAEVWYGAPGLIVGPNPFSASARVSFDLPGDPSTATLRVFDSSGALVRTLAEPGAARTGRNSILWDGRGARGKPVPSGLYIVRLDVGPLRCSVPLVRVR